MNPLNQNQKAALWLGISLIIVMGLYPPWTTGIGARPLPYAPIFMPPGSSDLAAHIDFERLIVQWIMAIVLAAGLIVSSHKSITTRSARASAEAQPGELDQRQSEKDKGGRRITSVAEHELQFPEGSSIGELLREAEDDPEYWQFLATAKGRVKVPASDRLQLELNKTRPVDLSALAKLPADSFYSLDLSGSHVVDSDLANIVRFTELYELDLSDTAVTDEAVKHLITLKKLRKLWLDNTKVTERGIEDLRSLANLAKLSLVGSKINSSQIQVLKTKFSQHCELVGNEDKA